MIPPSTLYEQRLVHCVRVRTNSNQFGLQNGLRDRSGTYRGAIEGQGGIGHRNARRGAAAAPLAIGREVGHPAAQRH